MKTSKIRFLAGAMSDEEKAEMILTADDFADPIISGEGTLLEHLEKVSPVY
ncbi:MAG: hypothetical protein IKN14_00350 [Clostridiales bacterium]|nr:hypothetical protein [Clostridiales bacterium]